MMKRLHERLTKISTARNTIVILAMLLSVDVFAQGSLMLELDPKADDVLSAALQKAADDAYQLNAKGLDALERKDISAALNFFEQALSIFPQYGDAFNNRGVALYRRGDIDGARRNWEEAIKRDPLYHVSYYNIGLIYLHSKKRSEAMKQFELALKHNKNFTEALVRVGAMYLQDGKTAAALDYLAKAYNGAPKHQDTWNFYSYGLLISGDTAAAIAVMKNAGDNHEAMAQLGRLEAVRRRYVQASEYFALAVKLGAPPVVMLDLASTQIDAGNCKDAQTILSKYIAGEARPSIDAWLLAGFAAKECGSASKAIEYYDKGLKQNPGDQMLLYNAGQLYFSMNNFALAEEMWNNIGDSYQDPQTLYKRAIAARFNKDLNGAEKYVRKAISIDENAEYYDFLGIILNAKGDDRAAEEQFKRALKIDPNCASAQLHLAVKSKSAADLSKAVEEASKRLSQCKNNCADAALQLSILYYHQKNYDKALSTLQSVSGSKNIDIYRHIAIYNKELQKYDAAIAALETASKIGGDIKVQYELAEAYLAGGYPLKAANKFIELRPKWKDNVWRLYYQLGYAYKDMNDLVKAKELFEKSLAAKDNHGARALLAFVLNRMGETDKALDQWEKTVKEDPTNATIHINLGLSYENKGEYDKALSSYQKALSLNPSDKTVNINLGNAYQGLGRFPEALREFTVGLESNKRETAAYNIFLLSRKRNDNDRAEKMAAILKNEFKTSIYYKRVSGEMDLLKGDTAKALEAYIGISDKDKDANDWFALAGIYAARGERAKAENALYKIPNNAVWEKEKKIVLAKTAFVSGDYKAAYLAYKDIAEKRFSGGSVYAYNAVLSANKAGMHKETVDAANNFEKDSFGADHVEICRIAGNSAAAVKNWQQAKIWFGKLAASEPNNAVTQYNLAVAHYNLGETDNAYGRYQKARELDKKIQNKDIELRYEELKSGKSASATKEVAHTATQRYRLDSTDVWYNRAVDLQNAKKIEQAEKLYKKILERDSGYSLAWNNLGAIYGARGDLEIAETAYLKALENQPAPETYANLANLYIAMEKYAEANNVISSGLSRHPGNQALSKLGRQISGKR